MSSILRRFLAGTAAATVLLISACDEEPAGPVDENQDFSGTYTLVSFSQGTAAGVTVIPGATGSFTMTATTYEVSTTIPTVPDPTVVNDSGTYTATGTATSGTFNQQSTLKPSLQYAGTYTWDPSTNQLTIDTTSQGVRTVLVVQRT